MPVDNPDGTHGIDIHIVDSGENAGYLEQDVSSSGMNDDLSEYYSSEYMGERVCFARQILLVPIEDDTLAGYADSPGYQSVVDGRMIFREDSEYTRRVFTITHELLHNIVGDLKEYNEGEYTMGSGHSFEGWLAGSLDELGPEPYGDNTYMSNITQTNINKDGMEAPTGTSGNSYSC